MDLQNTKDMGEKLLPPHLKDTFNFEYLLVGFNVAIITYRLSVPHDLIKENMCCRGKWARDVDRVGI